VAENHKFAGPVYCPRCKSEDVEFDEQEPLLAVYETPSMQNIDSASPYVCRRCMQAFYMGYDRSQGSDHSVTSRKFMASCLRVIRSLVIRGPVAIMPTSIARLSAVSSTYCASVRPQV